MENTITKEKLEKYLNVTEKALEIAKKRIKKERKQEAEEIINMVLAYFSDALHFMKNNDFVNSFAAVNYAHGWLDAGARLGIFNVQDNQLFVIK